MSEILDFLHRCLNEDEQAALRMLNAVWPSEVHVVPSMDTGHPDEGEPVGCVAVAPGPSKTYTRAWNPTAGERPDSGWVVHESAIPVWSKAVAGRTLADVTAKRQLIDELLYDAAIEGEEPCRHTPQQIASGECEEVEPHLIPALCILTRPYADRPGWRKGWGGQTPDPAMGRHPVVARPPVAAPTPRPGLARE